MFARKARADQRGRHLATRLGCGICVGSSPMVDHPSESPNELLELVSRLIDHFGKQSEAQSDCRDEAA